MWYQVAPYSYRVIQTLSFHGLMTLYGVLTLIYDDKRLRWKNCYKELIIISIITVWALVGNMIYNSESRTYNWLFVVQDPFYILPKNIAPFLMPFIIVMTLFTADMIIHLLYFISYKLIKKISCDNIS